MSQPTLNSSFSGINFAGMNRGSRLSYTSLRAASGDNSINEEERLSAPSVQAFVGSSRASLAMEQGSSSRLSQPDVRRFSLRQDVPVKRDRLSQPTLITGDYHAGPRGLQRLSQPCLSTGKDPNLPAMVFHSPSPPPVKHKRFSPAIHASQRDRLSQLDIGGKYRSLKEGSGTKFNRDRFSIPELETQNDLRLIAGTPKQRFSLDSQLTRNQDATRSRLLPIASSPISEQQQSKPEEQISTVIPASKLKSPTREGLGSVLMASTTPILPSSERQLLSSELSKRTGTVINSASTGNVPKQKDRATLAASKLHRSVSPIPTRERMSVPEIRNSSLRRLLDPPTRQRHSITGNLRHSIITPIKPLDFGRKSPKLLFEEALERFRRDEKEENRRNSEISNAETVIDIIEEPPRHIQKHYSYTYETEDGGSVLGKINMSAIPKKKYLESNFDENEQVITTVIETDVPMIVASTKYVKKASYSNETPKWIRKYLENESSPKVGRKTAGNNREKIGRKNSRRKSSLDSVEDGAEKMADKARSKSVSSGERSPMARNTAAQPEFRNMKNTYVTIVPSGKTQENRYEVKVEDNWMDGHGRGMYGDEYDDTDSDDSTSI